MASIIYFKKSDGIIDSTASGKSLDSIPIEKLRKESLPNKYSDKADQYDVDILPKGEKAQVGGQWDSITKKQIAPPVPIVPVPTPEQERIAELKEKFENQSASLKEVQEYLYLVS